MGSISRSLKRTTSAKRKEKGKKMHLLALTACLLLVVKMSEGAVAVGVGRLNPENPSECLDPDTGLNHTLGVAGTSLEFAARPIASSETSKSTFLMHSVGQPRQRHPAI